MIGALAERRFGHILERQSGRKSTDEKETERKKPNSVKCTSRGGQCTQRKGCWGVLKDKLVTQKLLSQ